MFTLKKPVIVIPSYWTKGKNNKEDIIYDHPTNLQNPNETLSKTLKSFENIIGEFDTIVVGCPTRPSIGEEVDKTIVEIIENSDLSFRTMFFGSKELEILKDLIDKNTSSKFSELISNKGYGNIRNLCLILPHLLGYETVVLIDDDELITDTLFIQKAVEFIGTRDQDKILGLVVGYYRNVDDSIFLDDSNAPWWTLVWEKEKLMNQAFQIITDPTLDRLVDTPFAFGGNMVIHKSCWKLVPFDPLIARGEDMDYLRNVKYYGFDAKLDRSLSIEHDPPLFSTDHKIKFRQDIQRFLYSKYKLEQMHLDPVAFAPYPGYFLEQTEGKIILTELLDYIYHNRTKLVELKDVNQFIDEIKNINFFIEEIQDECRNSSGLYFEFQKNWKELMEFLSSLEIPSNIISNI